MTPEFRDMLINRPRGIALLEVVYMIKKINYIKSVIGHAR